MAELLARIDSAELTEWFAFYNVEPFGPHREEWRAGVLATMTAKTGGQPADFFPALKDERPQASKPVPSADLVAKLRAVTVAMGGTVK